MNKINLDLDGIVKEKLASDEIRKMIDVKITDVIKGTINDEFKTWGNNDNAGSILQKIIKDSIALNLEKIKIPDIHALMIISVNMAFECQLNDRLKKMVDDQAVEIGRYKQQAMEQLERLIEHAKKLEDELKNLV